MNIQGKGKESVTYDAIVVGSGISGGWAAKELSEKGLKVLMIERGRELKHIEGYDTAMKENFDFPHRNRLTLQMKKDYWAGIRTGYTITEATKDLFVKDSEDPYEETQRFDWMRAYHTGGKSLHWGRQSYRWNERDFTANAEEGVGVDWPIRYKDLEPWYAYVEKFAGISGEKRGLDVLPDSVFQPAMELNCVEREVRKRLESKFPGRYLTVGRVAHLTNPTEEQKELGRTACQYRNKCIKGCPYGAYFSTQAATLPAAMKTNNLTLINDKIVYEVIFDDEKKKAVGVRAIDRNTKKVEEYYAKIIFLNAGAIGSAWILMQSKSKTHPNGLGNASDQLGRNIMDHHLGVGASGKWEGFEDMYYYGKRPNGIYIPRFANWGSDKRDFLRGFGYQGGASRGNKGAGDLIGVELKATYSQLGGWGFNIGGFGETLPDERNRFTLSSNKDQWGLPIINFDAAWRENEWKMREAMQAEAGNMLEAAGLKNVNTYQNKEYAPGIGIHEMGTARMGRDPKTSVLNGNNQVWGAENVFVTDGACMTSSSCVNPSLTYMALTARAADFAVNELKKQNL
ncbi:GMC family oxidoreductase [Leadbetterella byssophila]|uniref:Glucose-methanol-choline oxidoreductase n=1 Tax=Leadbetterella byssophila (strain DSM 17132 / JCM 16389 / KACC 11308 / NBRC 106382 / 4M15) TaxID=649349 RepID=E4RWM4_LEAB4|nr:GMC family oxidoreductase [Leadbetterella byssophila]ADQ18964.1 glucose-methanol-choline oxidoreductase [Leadbetterella byssophila DSM 17132]